MAAEGVCWYRQLEDVSGSELEAAAKRRLAAELESLRQRSALLSSRIAVDLPEFTLHDVNHLDALEEMAELIAGDDYPLNPLELFILQSSFLVHDLGLGMAAWPDASNLHERPEYKDIITGMLRQESDRPRVPVDFTNVPHEFVREAERRTLVALHAEKAEYLAQVEFEGDHGQKWHLIQNDELRASYAGLIGRIAHSHWWSLDRLAHEFEHPRVFNAPSWAPPSWTVDATTIALLLRCADAAQLDNRRAPGFLRAALDLSTESAEHWDFQSRLDRPRVEVDRLVYTSTRTFSYDKAPAWWRCYSALQLLDAELRGADELLGDSRRTRFRVRVVSGVASPPRLARQVATDGWIPAASQVRISDAVGIVRRLGGAALYGLDSIAPLRELIQNAIDACRARRCLDVATYEPRVTVQLSADCSELTVRDNGLGMSRAVLTGPLLDFGSSYWDSDLRRQEYPSLAADGFIPTGRFGIGFFSVFMWGTVARLVTRPFEASRDQTTVLEFGTGLDGHPVLRLASHEEHIADGGTAVSVTIDPAMLMAAQVLPQDYAHVGQVGLEHAVARLCATSDVAVFLERQDEDGITHTVPVVAESDWFDLSPEDLFVRSTVGGPYAQNVVSDDVFDRIRPLYGRGGELVGRLAVARARSGLPAPLGQDGLLTVGGLASSIVGGVIGIALAQTQRAARDDAQVTADDESMRAWATEQAEISECQYDPAEYADLSCRFGIAEAVLRMGGREGRLEICFTSEGPLAYDDLVHWLRDRDVIQICWSQVVRPNGTRAATIPLEAFLGYEAALPASLCVSRYEFDYRSPENSVPVGIGGRVLEAISEAWGLSILHDDVPLPGDEREDDVIGDWRARFVDSNDRLRAHVLSKSILSTRH